MPNGDEAEELLDRDRRGAADLEPGRHVSHDTALRRDLRAPAAREVPGDPDLGAAAGPLVGFSLVSAFGLGALYQGAALALAGLGVLSLLVLRRAQPIE